MNQLITALSLFFFVAFAHAKAPELTRHQFEHPPSKDIRLCCAFGSDMGIFAVPFFKKTDIVDAWDIGIHAFMGGRSENNGIVYTHRGGFLDLGHLRDNADWTAYLYSSMVAARREGIDLELNLGMEGGSKQILVTASQLAEQQDLVNLAGRIAYDIGIWHEIATWFGASYVPLLPERFSSFSPEDVYSNLLGINLSMQAIHSELPYEEAMTFLLNDMLITLEAVPRIEDTYAAMEEVHNIWWTREKPLPSNKTILKRYFDFDDKLEPWILTEPLVKSNPYLLDKPSCDPSSYSFQIELRGNFEVYSLHKQVGPIITQADFPGIVQFIESQQLTP